MDADALTHLTLGLRGLLLRQQDLDRDDDAAHPDPAARRRAADVRVTNLQAIDHLEQAIAVLPAAGAQEATLQVLIAAGRLQDLAEQSCDAALVGQLETIHRLLRAALPALAAKAELDLEVAGGHYGERPTRAHPPAATGGDAASAAGRDSPSTIG